MFFDELNVILWNTFMQIKPLGFFRMKVRSDALHASSRQQDGIPMLSL